MKRFEYKIERMPILFFSKYLDKFGEEGWELVTVYDRLLIFKRELPKKTIGGPR